VWETARARDNRCTCAQMFWWFNMYASVDWSVTPRPLYPADGRKIPDIYSYPSDLASRLTSELGAFPFFQFWGPNAGLPSSQWIADASEAVDRWFSPTILLVYLPHLDYDVQRYGTDDPRVRVAVRAIDEVCGRLIRRLRERGRRIIVLSEYGLVTVSRPIHINRILREAGLLAVRAELGLEALDPGASPAFAVADHQIAHVYVRDHAAIPQVKALLERARGIDAVLDRREQSAFGIDHERSGELVAIAAPDAWFTYYYWRDDQVAPDYGRTVDIHRKPGYDPAELFLDPGLRLPKVQVAATLLKKRLGFRYLLNVIPLDATLVKGSHGRRTHRLEDGPVIISSERNAVAGAIEAQEVRDLILSHVFDRELSPVQSPRT
jgi:predicted AlkP superfamily pyrophosphatase or phosphodiesterase